MSPAKPAKPVLGADGTRVPLLRPGFRPSGSYAVSFVYLHAGTPFAKKGDIEMTLPRMDMPVGIVEWEVFVPDNYSVRAIDGNVIDRRSIEIASFSSGGVNDAQARERLRRRAGIRRRRRRRRSPGGRSERAPRSDPRTSGGLPLAASCLASRSCSRQDDRARSRRPAPMDVPAVGRALRSGDITAQLAGFRSESRSFVFDQQPQQVDFAMPVGQRHRDRHGGGRNHRTDRERSNARERAEPVEPSQNVINLQRRAAGVLPVRVDVPRAGTSHQFVKPLVVDQETVVTFRYKRR